MDRIAATFPYTDLDVCSFRRMISSGWLLWMLEICWCDGVNTMDKNGWR